MRPAASTPPRPRRGGASCRPRSPRSCPRTTSSPTFESPSNDEDVGGDAVEEPAIVADDDGAAGEGEQRVLEVAQGVDVEVVGRLVEQQQVAALFDQLGEVDAVALAAGQHADLLLLVGAVEVELADVGAGVDVAAADAEDLLTAGDLLIDATCRGRARRGSGRRGDVDRLADLELAAVGLLLAGDHAKQRRLAGAVGADDADDAALRQGEVQVVEEQAVAEALASASWPRPPCCRADA
jgi:hypothetical protein